MTYLIPKPFYLSLSVAQGAAATADLFIIGDDLT